MPMGRECLYYGQIIETSYRNANLNSSVSGKSGPILAPYQTAWAAFVLWVVLNDFWCISTYGLNQDIVSNALFQPFSLRVWASYELVRPKCGTDAIQHSALNPSRWALSRKPGEDWQV